MDPVEQVYNRTARRYDVASRVPLLVGFRTDHYRRRAIASLGIQLGETVVLIGCGTGTDIGRVQRRLQGSGRILCVDLSAGMLDVARRKVAKRGWQNVEFWHGDAAEYPWPKQVDHVAANFTLKFQPRHGEVIAAAHGALRRGGRFVLTDFDLPAWLVPLALRLLPDFGHTEETLGRNPREALEKTFGPLAIKSYWFRQAYVAWAEKP